MLGLVTGGGTFWAVVPLALVGGLLGFFGRKNLRVAGLVLNLLALAPAVILAVRFGTGAPLPPRRAQATSSQQGGSEQVPVAGRSPSQEPRATRTQQESVGGEEEVRAAPKPPSNNTADATPTRMRQTDAGWVFSVPYLRKPAYLAPVTDSTFGTKLTRIGNDPGLRLTARHTGDGVWSKDARHNYSLNQPWNADGTLLAIENRPARGGSPNELFLDGNTYAVRFGTPSNMPCGGAGEERWHPSRAHANERIIAGWPGNRLYWFDVLRNVTTRSWDLPFSVWGIGDGKGNTSQNGRLVALTDHKKMFLVDMDPQPPHAPSPSGRIGPAYDLAAEGLRHAVSWVSVSPSGKYVPRDRAQPRRGPWESRRSRTRSSSGRSSWRWSRFTSRTSWTAPTASGPDGRRTGRCRRCGSR
jgi:hypothetical protein